MELYRLALRLNPEHPSSYRALGVLMLQQRLDLNEAADLLEKHLQVNLSEADAALVRQVIALAREGRYPN